MTTKTKYNNDYVSSDLFKNKAYLWRDRHECTLKKIGEFGSLAYFAEYDVYLTVDNKELS